MLDTFLCKQIAKQDETIHTLRITCVMPQPGPHAPVTQPATAVVSSQPAQLRISIMKEEVNNSTAIPVDSYEMAKRRFVEEVLNHPKIIPTVIDPNNLTGTGSSHIPSIVTVNIAKHANNIAAKSRRGGGNIVLYNKADMNFFNNAVLSPSYVFMDVDNIPQGTFIIMYKGQGDVDGPAYHVTSASGEYLYLLPAISNSLAEWTDYVGVVKIV